MRCFEEWAGRVACALLAGVMVSRVSKWLGQVELISRFYAFYECYDLSRLFL